MSKPQISIGLTCNSIVCVYLLCICNIETRESSGCCQLQSQPNFRFIGLNSMGNFWLLNVGSERRQFWPNFGSLVYLWARPLARFWAANRSIDAQTDRRFCSDEKRRFDATIQPQNPLESRELASGFGFGSERPQEASQPECESRFPIRIQILVE